MKQTIFTSLLILIFLPTIFAQSRTAPCPVVSVSGGGIVRPGDEMIFTAEVSGSAASSILEYEWTTTKGKIVSGQGTRSISIDTTGLKGENITAEVKIKGLYENCPNTASEIGSVVQPIITEPLDYFGKLSDDEIKARLANLYFALEQNLSSRGYIQISGTAKEIANRRRQIKKAIRFFKLDANRTTVAECERLDAVEFRTIVWIVPPGAKFPACD